MPDTLENLSNALVLAGRHTQDTRLIRLTTLPGIDLIPERVTGEEAIGQGFRFAVQALCLDAHLSAKAFVGQPALLQLLTASDGAGTLRPFHGHVGSFECRGANGGFARYLLTIEPWTAFLDAGRDSRVFQDLDVFGILDAVFSAYEGRGRVAPSWRYEIADRSVYPKRSSSTQYQESDLAFVKRLLHEEGLFYFFEHEHGSGAPGLGRHTMVIADHNGAFQPNAQPVVRFTQPGAVMEEDSIDRWRAELRGTTGAVDIATWDYRAAQRRSVHAADGLASNLASRDTPGAYAYPTRETGLRVAENQLRALAVARHGISGAGTVRTLGPGTHFALHGHPRHDQARDDADRTFVVLRVMHLMHNNLDADLLDAAGKLLGPDDAALPEALVRVPGGVGGSGERALYRNRIDVIPQRLPYRGLGADGAGPLLHPRPTVRGQQTAVVVGPPGAAIHTDCDHRIKIQFHWQRGVASHSRLGHSSPGGHTGAPGDDTAGTWVRVATPLAGANWGAAMLPRVGQEVLVDFLDGDIDRPVVLGALYGGRGQADAACNTVHHGAGPVTGNAPAWFPGEEAGHAHPAVLSGLRSQAMQSSQGGADAYSQMVFDDSPAQSRLALQAHAKAHDGAAELNLGHLRHQSDNERLQPAGFGAELKATRSTALRAGRGMLLTTGPASPAAGQLDACDALDQIEAAHQGALELAKRARQHNAVLEDEPETAKLPALAGLEASAEVLKQTAEANAGKGRVAAYGEPQLQLCGAAGIVACTPSDALIAAGTSGTVSAGQDIGLLAQGGSYASAKAGISLFSYGKATNKDKPNQETGIKLHAASGTLSSQSQSGATRITADKAVTVASVGKTVTVSAAKTHVLLTAQGAFIKLEGGNIMLHAPGKVEFKAGMKELKGPVSVPGPEIANKVHELRLRRDLDIEYVDADGNLLADEPIGLRFSDGNSRDVTLDANGQAVIRNAPLGPFRAVQPNRERGEES